jgi:hypothetical protein
MKSEMSVENFYDEYIIIKTEFTERNYHKVDDSVLRKFKLVFGSSLKGMFQIGNEKTPIDSSLTPKDIESTILIMKFDNKYVEFNVSEFASFNLLK